MCLRDGLRRRFRGAEARPRGQRPRELRPLRTAPAAARRWVPPGKPLHNLRCEGDWGGNSVSFAGASRGGRGVWGGRLGWVSQPRRRGGGRAPGEDARCPGSCPSPTLPPAVTRGLCSNSGTGGSGGTILTLSDSKLNFSFHSRHSVLTQKAKVQAGGILLGGNAGVLLQIWEGLHPKCPRLGGPKCADRVLGWG